MDLMRELQTGDNTRIIKPKTGYNILYIRKIWPKMKVTKFVFRFIPHFLLNCYKKNPESSLEHKI